MSSATHIHAHGGASLVYFRARASEWEGGNGRTESHGFFGGRVVFFFMSLPLFPEKKRSLSVPLRFYKTLQALLRVMHASCSVPPRLPTVELARGPSLELTRVDTPLDRSRAQLH